MKGSRSYTITIKEEIARKVEEAIKEEGLDLNSFMEEIIDLGISQWKKKKALELYKKGKITLSQASSMCGASIYELIDEIRKMGIPITVYTEDLREIVFQSARSRAEYYRMLEELGKE